MLLLLLQAVLILAQTQTWCGYPECPARPKCTNAELDLIIAIDESCSMASADFDKEKNFSVTLARAAEQRFNVSRFAGINFGYQAAAIPYQTPVPQSSTLFHSMQAGASSFASSMPTTFVCGGTPTDEALALMYAELKRSQVAGRLQVAVLLTDGIPTLCYTKDANCDGTSNAANELKAANAAITERFLPNKLPDLGALVLTVAIGNSTKDPVGNTDKYGSINGQQLLAKFSSAPQFALLATNFQTLITQTLQQVLDLLCFYFIDVLQPQTATCYSGGTLFVIRGYNFFPMGQPKCRWQQVGTSNFYYTNATVNVTSQTYNDEPGTIGLISCSAPIITADLNAYLEISRDGTYYTSNQYSVFIRKDCSAARSCPVAAIAGISTACNITDFESSCQSGCSDAGAKLGAAFDATSAFPAFTAAQIKSCISNSSLSAAEKSLLIAKVAPGQNPCDPLSPTLSTTSGSTAIAASFFCIIGFLLV